MSYFWDFQKQSRNFFREPQTPRKRRGTLPILAVQGSTNAGMCLLEGNWKKSLLVFSTLKFSIWLCYKSSPYSHVRILAAGACFDGPLLITKREQPKSFLQYISIGKPSCHRKFHALTSLPKDIDFLPQNVWNWQNILCNEKCQPFGSPLSLRALRTPRLCAMRRGKGLCVGFIHQPGLFII